MNAAIHSHLVLAPQFALAGIWLNRRARRIRDVWTSTATVLVLLIWVRRFLCRHCRISVGCLPEFAQPYRPVDPPTIAAGFNGEATRPEVQRWSELIKGYWRRFETHLPALVRQVGNAFGSLPLAPTAKGFWEQLLQHCGTLARATKQLIDQFHTCLFGTDRCHQRRQLQAA